MRRHQSLFAQRLDCFAHGGPADSKLTGEIALRWQLIPGLEGAL